MNFNGIDMTSILKVNKITGRGLAEWEVSTLSVSNRDGLYHKKGAKRRKERIINVDFTVMASNMAELREKIDELNAILDVDEAKPLVFPDEPNKTYYAIPETSSNGDDGIDYINQSTIKFVCPDPYKYGPEIPLELPSDHTTFTYNGTADGYPVFELEVETPVTMAMIQNQDNEFMMIGKPYDITTQQPFIPEEKVMRHEMDNLIGWTAPDSVEDGVVTGSMASDGYRVMPQSYGTGTGWHGPALKTSIPGGPLQDFKLEAIVEFWNTNHTGDKVGKLEVDLLNDTGKVIARVALADTQFGSNLTIGQARAGSKDLNHYMINYGGDIPGVWNNFYGLLRILRKGNYWEAYITLMDPETDRHHTSKWVSWVDTDSVIMDQVAQVQIYMAQFANNTPVDMGLHHINIWKYNENQVGIPYIAQIGDVITFDHQNGTILLNGEDRMDLKNFGATFFKLKKGKNQLSVMPANSFKVTCKYRERFA